MNVWFSTVQSAARDDVADVLRYKATVEFTVLAGDLLVPSTREFGDVRA